MRRRIRPHLKESTSYKTGGIPTSQTIMTSISEFAIIARFFHNCGHPRPDCLLGIGDDAALLQVPPGWELVVTQDTLVAGVHFFTDADPKAIGYKALAVNLSDLAAMGAQPAWFTLGLTIPHADQQWLTAFAAGLCRLANEHGILLVGGDTTRGPLTLSITAMGFVPASQALRRKGARPGDVIYVSGCIGDAGLALLGLQHGHAVSQYLRQRLDYPTPQVALGQALRGIASAVIDISDGLAADLGHVLASSGVGADLQFANLPLSPEVSTYVQDGGDWLLPLSAGDDYELCFTVPPSNTCALQERIATMLCQVKSIGVISSLNGLRMCWPNGQTLPLDIRGYSHF